MTEIVRLVVDNIYPTVATPILYDPETIQCHECNGTGRGVKIAILDAGIPNHKAITNIVGEINFSTSATMKDELGHTTMISGLLAANSLTSITGIAPDVKLYIAKMVNDNCTVKFDAFVSSVLWAIIKHVDIIVIPLSTPLDNIALKKAIQKAYNNDIVIIASAGNHKNIDWPAAYDEVISVGALDSNGKLASFSASGDVNVLGCKLETTYLEQNYALISGTSASTAFVAGLCARLIENFRKRQEVYTPKMIYEQIKLITTP